jgi:hypothetical protein
MKIPQDAHIDNGFFAKILRFDVNGDKSDVMTSIGATSVGFSGKHVPNSFSLLQS